MQLLKSGILCLALWTLCILLGTGSLSWLLDALSPLKVLGRGYAVARNEQGQILRAAQEATAGEKIEVLLGQGSLNCTVNACNTGGNDDGKNV